MNSTSKLFVCERCDKTFRSLRDLDVHKARTKTHDYVKRNEHNEVVYECDVCNHEFKYAGNLVAHRKNFKHESKNSEERNHPTYFLKYTTLSPLPFKKFARNCYHSTRVVVIEVKRRWKSKLKNVFFRMKTS